MKPNPVHRLPAALEAAVQRLKLSAREAAERSVESLGLAALAATQVFQRDNLLGAQFELNRKSAVFALAFSEAYDQRVLREVAPRPAGDSGKGASIDFAQGPAAQAAPTHWASLSLVDDQEVEAQIAAERFGMEIAHACEWELRELEAYVSAILGEAGGEPDRNPLRPDLIGHAVMRAVAAVSDREDVRKLLSAELSRSLCSLLRTTYADIMAGLRNAGVQPQGLAVRNRAQRRPDAGAGAGGPTRVDGGDTEAAAGPGADERHSSGAGHGYGADHRLGAIDPTLMSLIRELNHGDEGQAGDSGLHGAQPRNLIRAHRQALRQASAGALDHLVIDLIGFMFDQILADPKVPPQLARQIARLQLPVLRAALGDPTFFSSRKHPVRRFINRIASLGSAFEDFNDDGARQFFDKVRSLVQDVAEGDFDRLELYEQKLAALEAYSHEASSGNDQGQADAAALLSEKEDQQRLRELYAQRLAGDLKDLDAPPFLRDFLAGVWGQVLLSAGERGGPNGPLAQRLRGTGRELFLSVQPKATAQHRKAFLAELPKLMHDLTEGMNLIAWPEAQRRAFFGQLMPCHAEALKTTTGRTLDINLMARKLDGVLLQPPPSRAELASAPLPAAQAVAPPLTAEEAQRVGLVQESAVDWTGAVDIQVGDDAAATAEAAPSLPGLPEPTDAAEPTEGRALAEHLQVGYPYQMHIDGQWQKVRLSHVSAARSFFIFTQGSKHHQTVSLTQRMLLRLCETGRLKAFETSDLVERATARARRQLAGLSA